MKRVVIFAAAAMGVALTQSALAADLGVRAAPPVYAPPVVVAPTWTGVYIGFNGGWGWSSANNNTLTLSPTTPVGALGAFPVTTFGGNNIRNNNNGGTVVVPTLGTLGSGFINAKQEWLASIRGRLGYTWGPGMIYVTGGGAWTGVKVDGGATIASATTIATGTFDQSSTLTGWVVGAGYEWMIAPNWALRGEYLYYGFNNSTSGGTLTFPITGANVIGNTGKLNTSVVRVGLDYKFDWLR